MEKTKRKTNEARICGHIARLAGIGVLAGWGDQSKAVDQAEGLQEMPWFFNDLRLMPFESDVMSLIMHDKTAKMDNDLMLELMSDPGEVLVVQDSRTSGPGSIWLVSMERYDLSGQNNASYAATFPCRAFSNAFEFDGKWWCVMALQLSSLFRKGAAL